MPKICINRPNRKRIRKFSACDAARIAREVTEDDPLQVTPEQVMACIAKGFGFTHISLSRQTTVESSFKPPIRETVVILEKTVTLIEFLSKKFPSIAKVLLALLPALKKSLEFLTKIDTIDPPQAAVDDVLDTSKCKCKGKGVKDVKQ